MSRITKKLAVAIATEMVARCYNPSIQYLEERLSNVLTDLAKKHIPKEVFEFIKNYPEFIATSLYMSVTSIIGGKRVYLQGRINTPIPNKPLYHAISEYTYMALRELQGRILELRRNRADMHKDLFERIYECKTTARLEKEYPDAYKVMLELKVIEETKK